LVGRLDVLNVECEKCGSRGRAKRPVIWEIFGMDIYHAWCDLKSGVSDTEFSDKVAAYMGHLRDQRLIASWRLTRSKLGLKPPVWANGI
jgi:hypothetical protein